MKRFIIVLLLVFTGLAFAQSFGISFSDPIEIEVDDLNGNAMRPRIVIPADGYPAITWGMHIGGIVGRPYVTKLQPDGSFSPPQAIAPEGQNIQLWHAEGPEIAANGSDIFVTYSHVTGGTAAIYVAHSEDGGSTFLEQVRVDPNPGKILSFSDVTVDNLGNPIVSYMHYESSWFFPEYLVARSWDGGLTFEEPVEASGIIDGEPCDCCGSEIIVEDSLVFLVWRNNIDNIRDTYVVRSTNAGESFETAARVDSSGWLTFVCPSSPPTAIISDGALRTAWITGVEAPDRFWMSDVDLASLDISPASLVAPGVEEGHGQNNQRVTGYSDTTAAVWTDARTGHTSSILSVSLDGPTGFEASVVIQDQATSPDIAYANGVFHIVYQDLAAHAIKYVAAILTPPTNIQDPHVSPTTFELYQNYPNPFNPNTMISLQLAVSCEIELAIFNVSGQMVRLLTTGHVLPPGQHMFEWDGTDEANVAVPSGVYFYQARTSDTSEMRKMILVR